MSDVFDHAAEPWDLEGDREDRYSYLVINGLDWDEDDEPPPAMGVLDDLMGGGGRLALVLSWVLVFLVGAAIGLLIALWAAGVSPWGR